MLAIFCLLTTTIQAQNLTSTRYWVKRGEDTIYCKKVRSSQLIFVGSKLKYTTADDKKVKLSGTKDCKKVKSYGRGATTFDLVPLNPEKPKYMRYMARYVDGPVRVNMYIHKSTTTTKSTSHYTNNPNDHFPDINTGRERDVTETKEYKHFYIKLPSGKYYRFTRNNMKDKVVPFLNTCERVKVNYEDQKLFKYSPATVIDMIKIYNQECAPVE